MKRNSNIIIKGFLFLFVVMIVSCDYQKGTIPKNVIQVERTVGNYSVLNLSEFATEIRYIPLETNDSALVSTVNQVIYEDEKLLIKDRLNNCWLFDSTGKFCRKIGQKGQGPDDYIAIRDIYLWENEIFLTDRQKLFIYDTNGNLVEILNLGLSVMPEKYKEYTSVNILPLKKDTYIMNFALYSGYYPTAILLEKNQSDLKMIKEYPNSVILDKLRASVYFHEWGIMYRFKDEMRVHKMINDTVFTIDQNAEMKDVFIFDLGKYRTTHSYYELKEGDTDQFYRKKFISVMTFYESSNHLFIAFDFGNHAPEPFEVTSIYNFEFTISDVYGVFDKNTGELTLMRQPIKGKLGFKNDIDNGPVIWPRYISSNNELVTSISAEDFLDYYEKTETPTPQMTEIAQNINLDDNPIIIIAKLK